MICQRHTLQENENVQCSKCGCTHYLNKEFVVVEGVADMIDAKLANFDFGDQHKKTKESCDQLKNLTSKNESMFDDLHFHIHEEISLLKNRVMLRGEELKKEIDEISLKMIDDLNKYENECKRGCTENGEATEFKNLLEKLREQNEYSKEKLNGWSSILNELIFDENKWKKIQEECDETFKKMSEQLKLFEKELFMNNLDLQRNKVIV